MLMARVGVFPGLARCADDGGCQPDAQAPALIRSGARGHDVNICSGVLHQGRAAVGAVRE